MSYSGCFYRPYKERAFIFIKETYSILLRNVENLSSGSTITPEIMDGSRRNLNLTRISKPKSCQSGQSICFIVLCFSHPLTRVLQRFCIALPKRWRTLQLWRLRIGNTQKCCNWGQDILTCWPSKGQKYWIIHISIMFFFFRSSMPGKCQCLSNSMPPVLMQAWC